MDQILSSLSPVKKTKNRSFEKDVKIKQCTISRKRVTRKSKHSKTSSTEDPKILLTVENLPTEDFKGNMSEKKVKEWLDATKFSQVGEENFKETIVVDVHVPDSELTAFSEEQLKSVTQVDCESFQNTFKLKTRTKSTKTSPGLDDIRPFDEINEFKCSSGVKKPNKNTTLVTDEFDELLPLKKKGQLVNSTYEGKTQSSSNQRSKRIFPVESDIFKSVVEPVHRDTESVFGELIDPSQATLKDFSSGSGEEWVADLKKEQSLKSNNSYKNLENNSNKCLEMTVTRRSSRLARQDLSNSVDKSKSKKLKVSQKNHSESKSSSSNIAKILEAAFPNNKCQTLVEKITAEWGGSEVDIQPTEQVKEFNKHAACNTLFDSVEKSTPIQRSPGWSRLKTTKKEFHMSEKKKLCLKTLNSSISRSMTDISPVCVQDQSLVESYKQSSNESVVSKNPSPLKENVSIEKEKGKPLFNLHIKQIFDQTDSTLKPEIVLNKSVDSYASPFKGFLTPKITKDSKSCPKFKEASNSLCNLNVPMKEIWADSKNTFFKGELTTLKPNASESPSNANVVGDKCKDLFNLSETKLKTNILDLKSSSVNEIPTLPFLPTEYVMKSSCNALKDVLNQHCGHQKVTEQMKDLPQDGKRTREDSAVESIR